METEREGSRYTEVLTMYRASWHDTVGIWKASCFFCSGPRGQLWTVRFVPAKFLCVIRSSPGSFCQRHSLLPCLAVSGQWTGDTTFFHMCFGPSRRELSYLHRPACTSVVCIVIHLSDIRSTHVATSPHGIQEKVLYNLGIPKVPKHEVSQFAIYPVYSPILGQVSRIPKPSWMRWPPQVCQSLDEHGSHTRTQHTHTYIYMYTHTNTPDKSHI